MKTGIELSSTAEGGHDREDKTIAMWQHKLCQQQLPSISAKKELGN